MYDSGQFFTFGPTVSAHSLSIDIVDDDIFEARYEIISIGFSAIELRGLHFRNVSLAIIDDSKRMQCNQSV